MSVALATLQQPVATTLGIIAGGGFLPRQLIESCIKEGRGVFVAAVEGETYPETVKDVPHVWLRLGALGAALEHFRKAGAKELVLAGKINRPRISSLRPDTMGAKLIARLGLSLLGGDAAMLKTIIAFLEEQGFRIVGIDDLMKDLVAPAGALGKIAPDKQAESDIALGMRVARAIGAFDVGQAAIIKTGLVLGIEAAEGTDALIERCSELRGEGKGGVLVKVRKPVQENRVDLPAIGIQTVELVHRAGFAGIAIEAGHSLIVGRREVVEAANAAGLFIFGFTLKE